MLASRCMSFAWPPDPGGVPVWNHHREAGGDIVKCRSVKYRLRIRSDGFR